MWNSIRGIIYATPARGNRGNEANSGEGILGNPSGETAIGGCAGEMIKVPGSKFKVL